MGQQVPGQDARWRRAEAPGRQHEVFLFEREDLRPDDPGRIRPAKERDDEHDHPDSRLQDDHQEQHQEQLGHADRQVDQAHERGVDLAAGESGDPSHHEGCCHDDHGRRDPDRQRYAPTPQEPAEEVTPQTVGSEEELGVGRQRFAQHRQPFAPELLRRVVGRHQRREDGQRRQQQKDDGGDQRQPLPAKPSPGIDPPRCRPLAVSERVPEGRRCRCGFDDLAEFGGAHRDPRSRGPHPRV